MASNDNPQNIYRGNAKPVRTSQPRKLVANPARKPVMAGAAAATLKARAKLGGTARSIATAARLSAGSSSQPRKLVQPIKKVGGPTGVRKFVQPIKKG